MPPTLRNEIFDRLARGSALTEAVEGWRPSAAATALRDRVEVILEGGLGFCLLRGFTPSGIATVDERALLLLGLLFGRPVSQTKRGNFVARVQDLGRKLEDPTVRGHQTAAELGFHCDRADRVLLLCVRTALLGGRSLLVSARALADALAVEAPDLAARLYHAFPQDRRGEEPPGEPPFIMLPIFSERNGIFVARYVRRFIEDSQRHLEAPRLTRVDIAAMDALDAAIRRDGVTLEMPFQPGDVQILNNNVIFHARTAFHNDPATSRHRLLLRVWLAHASARPLPESFVDLYGAISAGAYRGGVWPYGKRPPKDAIEALGSK